MVLDLELEERKKERRKENITLSIDTTLLEEVRKEAESQGLSINAKINLILGQHENYYKHVKEQDSMIIPREAFLEILELIDEEKFLQILNRVAANIMPSFMLHGNLAPTIDNLIKYCFESIFVLGGMLSKVTHYKDDSGYISIVLEHKYGLKWSRIIGKSLCYFVENMTGNPVQCKTLSHTVVLKILEK